MTRRARSRLSLVAAVALVVAVAVAARGLGASHDRFVARSLVSDGGVPALHHDRVLVNAWGLAASPTGPWWVTSEARDVSTLYSGEGRKGPLDVAVPGGPTGIAYYGGRQFLVRGRGRVDPARFVYACEDGRIRAWTPTVPTAWSNRALVTVDGAGEAAIFRGVAFARGRLYATDFHNDRVDVFDGDWHRVATAGGFRDAAISAWYAPDGIAAAGDRIFVTYVYRAPVDGNDAPAGGFVDEFDLAGHLVARVAGTKSVNEPWGLAVAPSSFGRFGGDLLVASFGDGEIDAFRRTHGGWRPDGALPVHVPGVWGIAFGNGGDAGPRDTLFAAAGPHGWIGATELAVHGRLMAIAQA